MTYYGYAAIWDDGVNFGYSENLIDAATQSVLVGLAGQNQMKFGIILDIDAFRNTVDYHELPLTNVSDNPEDGKCANLDLIFETLCNQIKIIEPEALYSGYISPNHATYEFNNETVMEGGI